MGGRGMEGDVVIELLESITHPYPKYGLGVALYRDQSIIAQMNEKQLSGFLAQSVESGLGHFRMRTEDKPSLAEVLHYEAIRLDLLRDNTKLVQSSGLAAQGVYLYPGIVTTDGGAKGTYDNAETILKDLRAGKSLDSAFVFSRSFAPTTAKINNGKKSLSEPRGTLLEAACSVITTVTPIKPAAWVGRLNTIIIPDLPLKELFDFIELFGRMMAANLDGDLMQAKLPKQQEAKVNKAPVKVIQKKQTAQTKSEYRRPRLHNGNYPFAPQRDAAAFGAVGLLGAIGRWAREAHETAWADRVLEALVDKPLYIISYDDITQTQFGHHIVGLSRNGKLSEIVHGLASDTRIGPEIDSDRPAWDDPKRQIFHLMSSRFLQLFTTPSFRDFLMTRTQYPAQLQPLFKEYFMEQEKVPVEIVEAAGALGQWLNRTAYFAADGDVDKKKPKVERDKEVKKAKAKIIINLESVAMSAKAPQAMISQVLTQAGRLEQGDAPAEAKPFIDAAMTGQISPEVAQHLLMAYMRLRSASNKAKEPDPYATDEATEDTDTSTEV